MSGKTCPYMVNSKTFYFYLFMQAHTQTPSYLIAYLKICGQPIFPPAAVPLLNFQNIQICYEREMQNTNYSTAFYIISTNILNKFNQNHVLQLAMGDHCF